MTSDIHRRILEYNSGLVKSSKHLRFLEVIHFTQFENKSDALAFEKLLKNKKSNINFQLLKNDMF